MKKLVCRVVGLFALLELTACGFLPYGAYTNKVDPQKVEVIDQSKPSAPSQTSFHLRKQRQSLKCDQAGTPTSDPKLQRDVLVLLALSGGGSRAAYFSALSMMEMEKLKLTIGDQVSDVLHEVDAISSVSGGSMAAAYYAASHDPGHECAGQSGHSWDENTVRDLMTKNYLNRWVGNWFWPSNIFKYWLSPYDRTDIMAQTMADNLFNKSVIGMDLSLGQLNPLRPNLILNSTIGSSSFGGSNNSFGQVFTFTSEDFGRICSDVSSYSVARGVMASATFPGAFNFMTLCDFCWKKDEYKTQSCTERADPRYLHVFDGGNADNLGLTSIKRVLWDALDKNSETPRLPYRKIVVILVDSFISSSGADSRLSDARGAFDFWIDLNFIDATDSLLQANRQSLLTQFETGNVFPFGAGRGDAAESCRGLLPDVDVKYCDKPSGWWDSLNEEFKRKKLFVHLQFSKVGDVVSGAPQERFIDSRFLMDRLLKIRTNFKLESKAKPVSPLRPTLLKDQDVIACATPLLFGREDYAHCEDLRPMKSNFAEIWGQVKCVLENPGAACGIGQTLEVGSKPTAP
ncbi:MAG TPA: patatin-like phospholipase family protein [Burkholderiales bacterium]|nr:patatin-like phospholipase family protein [Burkholderiales bacterium]